jgi:hypothetical protein
LFRENADSWGVVVLREGGLKDEPEDLLREKVVDVRKGMVGNSSWRIRGASSVFLE